MAEDGGRGAAASPGASARFVRCLYAVGFLVSGGGGLCRVRGGEALPAPRLWGPLPGRCSWWWWWWWQRAPAREGPSAAWEAPQSPRLIRNWASVSFSLSSDTRSEPPVLPPSLRSGLRWCWVPPLRCRRGCHVAQLLSGVKTFAVAVVCSSWAVFPL